MKIWVDDVRPAPEGYEWCKSVNETIQKIKKNDEIIQNIEELAHNAFLKRDYAGRNAAYRLASRKQIELLDLDHDAGDYAMYGGDYIEILNWLEEQGWSIPIRLHTMNPVGRDNMRRIIEKNGWTEVL